MAGCALAFGSPGSAYACWRPSWTKILVGNSSDVVKMSLFINVQHHSKSLQAGWSSPSSQALIYYATLQSWVLSSFPIMNHADNRWT